MAAAMNGMALHGGIIPYSGTFLVFTDYCRPAIRLAALMGERVIYVMTHDSIGLGEDGPTHQPVEHLAALRAIPNLPSSGPATRSRRRNAGSLRWRPRAPERAGADAAEPAAAAARRSMTGIAAPSGAYEIVAAPAARPMCRSSRPARRWRSRSTRRSCWPTGRCGARRLGAVLRTVLPPRRGDTPQRDRRRAGPGRHRGGGAQGWDAIIGTDGVSSA